MSNLPRFDDLPAVKGMPHGCAWGLFDKDGKKDVFGTLNLLTPEIVKAAASEVKSGHHVSLNWPIGGIKTPGFGRKGLVHKVLDFKESPLAIHGYDDEVEFNTQCSSQWDSLCHFHHQASQCAYNGIKTNAQELSQDFGHSTDPNRVAELPTLNHWHKRGGLVARGVFLDYRKWADEQGKKVNCFDADKITIADLEEVAKKQGVSFKEGDVLIIRSGFTEELGNMNAEQQEKAMGSHRVVGVEGNVKAAKWIWDNRFSAVAGDMIAFEHIPAIRDSALTPSGEGVNEEGTVGDLVLHQYLITLMGMSIGELWDLKALSEHCAKSGRYTFMLTSVPLNVPGGVGSPPNAIAIF